MDSYIKQTTIKNRENMLKDIQISSRIDESKTRCLGPAISNKVFKIFTSDCPENLVYD